MNAGPTFLTKSSMRPGFSHRAIACLGCAALLLAGCSGAADDNNTNNTTSNNTTANNTTATNNTTANNTTATNNTTANNTTSTNNTNNTTSTNNETTVTLTILPLDATSGMMIDSEICARGTDTCATGTGELSIEVTPGTDLAISVASEGFVTGVWYVNLDEDTSYRTSLFPDGAFAAVLSGFGFADDDTKGHVFFNGQSETAGLAGVSFTLAPDTSEGVLYVAASGSPDPELMATELGNGAFLNVDPGEYEVTAAHDTLSCAPPPGLQLAGDAPSFDVVAGEATYVFSVCTP